MQVFQDVAAGISADAWIAGGGVLLLGLLFGGWPYIRQAWAQARFNREMRRHGEMAMEDYRAYMYTIEEDLPAYVFPSEFLRASGGAALTFGVVAAADLGLEDAFLWLTWGMMGVGLVYGWWRKINDPPVPEDEQPGFLDGWGSEWPPEAIWGAAIGIPLSIGMLLILTQWF